MSKNLNIMLCGVTASGKSALAIRLAKALDGVIVNCDSMQVYRDLNILSARPSPQDLSEAEHLCYGDVDGAINFSVGGYYEKIESLLKTTTKPLIFCGGTGLYFKALLMGLSSLPQVSDKIRSEIRQQTENLETKEIHALLRAKDEKSAALLHENDRLRTMRALEVVTETGISMQDYYQNNPPIPLINTPHKYFLSPNREKVYGNINSRYIKMFETGALEEVAAIKARNLDPLLPVMRAHGVPSLIKYINGETTKAEAIDIGQQDTRNYAKRQWTWFRGQQKDFVELAPQNAYDNILNDL